MATVDQLTKSIFRKIKCLPHDITNQRDKLKNLLAPFFKNEICKKILMKNIDNYDKKGMKLSKADRFKDNISFLIQVYLDILTKNDSSVKDQLKQIKDAVLSYADHGDIKLSVNKFTKDGEINPIITRDNLQKLETIRGMIDCYCKSIVNFTDAAQVTELKKCFP